MLRTKLLKNGFMDMIQLKNMGFNKIGKNIKISQKCSIYNPGNIIIGNNVRIDDFCILSAGENGKIDLGNFVHIAHGAKLFGSGGIKMCDFSGLASDGKIYSSTDDFSGEFMTGPAVFEYNPNLVSRITKSIIIGKHTVVGTNTVVLPGCNICDNCNIGGMSLVNKSIEKSGIYFGIPIKFIKDAKNGRILLEKQFFDQK
jgi:acetyltransferase-like isoleucine patch superfamily enzyme